MATAIQDIMGGIGVMEYISSSVSGKAYDFVIVNEAATLSTLTSSGGANLLNLYNLSGASLASGIVIKGAKGEKISAITVSAGSVIGYTNI